MGSRLIALILALLPLSVGSAELPVRIALIDTGAMSWRNDLCPAGHYDFIMQRASVGTDYLGHGTMVANAIKRHAPRGKYCLLVYKIFDKVGTTNRHRMLGALKAALQQGAHIVNLSMSGKYVFDGEYTVLKALMNRGAIVFAAAGNDKEKLGKTCIIYPACYPGVQAVGALWRGERHPDSNYGPEVDVWEQVVWRGDGTSVAAGIASGKQAAFMRR